MFRASKDSLDSLSRTDVQQQWGRVAASTLYEPRPIKTFCHVQRQKKFPEGVQKEILKQLDEGAPDSALAKHKKRVQKQRILQQTSNGSDAPRILGTLFIQDHTTSTLGNYATFQFL